MRVGRAAIDEQAMRLLEQHNPDVEFDWSRILKDAPAEPRRDRDRDPRERDRRDRRDLRPPQRPRPLETTAAAVPPAQSPSVYDREADAADVRAAAHADLVLSQPVESLEPVEPLEPEELVEREGSVEPGESESLAVEHGEPLAADHAEYVEYAEASASVNHHLPEPAHAPEAPRASQPPHDAPASAAGARLGSDGLLRLRQRYTQLVARVAEKPMEDEARAELNAQVERLNPDAWLTADEVAAALEQYESVFDRLRSVVGHSPSRRRRR